MMGHRRLLKERRKAVVGLGNTSVLLLICVETCRHEATILNTRHAILLGGKVSSVARKFLGHHSQKDRKPEELAREALIPSCHLCRQANMQAS
ncbi:uncharacterized protein RCO7_14665 [Rhynchosporium graminicola]|uniref:Uncharacterized protein n=1 Tax=Rhynchosporium graminicola TaxID=2792576 RepID=A0A1E1KUS2_9HELO|nr:uncharacterized protein RCO7_14665 [Rhynchosporium commune]